MSTSFTIPASTLSRIASLRHATEIGATGALAHVHLALSKDTARLTATEGRLLAILRLPVSDIDGDPIESLLLDGAMLNTAAALLIKATGSVVRFTIDTEAREVRLVRGTVVAIVRTLALAYPVTTHFLDRYRGQTLVPAIASFSPSLLNAATKIVGAKQGNLLLWSPTTDSDVARCWSGDTTAPLSRDAMGSLVRAPGIWTDGANLMILLMPVTRSSTDAPDIAAFLSPMPEEADDTEFLATDEAEASADDEAETHAAETATAA